MARILVSGSESFIGQALIRQALAAGHVVCGLDCLPPRTAGYTSLTARLRDPDLAERLRGRFGDGLDAVVHLAALSRDSDCQQDVIGCYDTNLTGTLALYEATPNAQFLFASSEWIYDHCTEAEAKAESAVAQILNLNSAYAISKLAAEAALRQLSLAQQRALTVLRFGIVYGPRPHNWSAVESLYHAVASREEITVGSLRTARCFVHVEDIAAGILAALGQPGYQTFNLAAAGLIRLEDVIRESCLQLGRSPVIHETAPDQYNVRYIDIRQASERLGWRPNISLSEGLASLQSILSSA